MTRDPVSVASWEGYIRPRVLVACHCSMVVVEELRAIGVEAYSVDLKDAEKPTSFHIKGDALDVLRDRWDGLVASPVCKVLANSGAKHLYVDGKKENGVYLPRWQALESGAAFFDAFNRAGHIPVRLIENSIMHRHAREKVGRQTQVCQPWWFGDPFFKGMALWIHGAPPVEEDPAVSLRAIVPKPGTEEHKRWSACWMEAPGPEREANRSRTHPGTARAWAQHMAQNLLCRQKEPQLFERLAA